MYKNKGYLSNVVTLRNKTFVFPCVVYLPHPLSLSPFYFYFCTKTNTRSCGVSVSLSVYVPQHQRVNRGCLWMLSDLVLIFAGVI